jgi:VanZ family protein
MPDPKRPFASLPDLLTHPPAWLRLTAATLALVLAASLFYHGAQPYAVGLFPRPWDKLVHLAFFGGMAGLAWIVLGGRGAGAHLGAVGIAVGIGLLDEVAQMRLPGRSVDIRDFAADFVGAALAVLLLWAVRARRVRSA